MNLKSFAVGLISGHKLNGAAELARQAGERHADELIGAYADGFESRATEILATRQRRLLGTDDAIDVEFEKLPGPTRPAKAAKRRR